MYYRVSFITFELKKGNSKIYRALFKYGYSNFKLEILEYCEAKDTISREQYYLDLLKPEYNILKIDGSPFGRKLSEQTKTKMKTPKSLSHRISMKAAATGRKLSEEYKLKKSIASKGEKNPMLGKTYTEKERKLRGIKLGTKILVTNVETTEVVEYYSMREAGTALDISNVKITRYLNNKKLLNGKYKIELFKPS